MTRPYQVLYMKIFLSIFFLIGMYLLGISLFGWLKMLDASDWPQVPGYIESATFTLGTSKPSTTTEKIIYSYQVGDQKYKNNRIKFGVIISSNNRSLSYREGEQVNVFYNPNHPADSVLNRSDAGAIIFGVVSGVLFVAFSLLGFRLLKSKA